MKKIFTFLSVVLLSTGAQSQTFTNFAGTGSYGYSGDGGLATSAKIAGVGGMAFDQAGNLYFSDKGNNVIRMVNLAGIISTVVGTGVAGSLGDGGPASSAQLNRPDNIVFDAAGNLYIKETKNGKIRKVDVSGNISTYATIATSISRAAAMAIDGLGNLYINNDNNVIVEKINTSTVATTYAGMVSTQGGTGDGGLATAAKLWQAFYLTTDVSGNLYIAEYQANTIRKVNNTGTITTIAGTFNSTSSQGFGGTVGDGGAATAAYLSTPRGMAVNSSGDLYFAADYGKIRFINSAGLINSIASGSNILNAELLIFDSFNNLYYSEASTNQIKKISNLQISSTAEEVAGNKVNFSIYPNPANKSVNIHVIGSPHAKIATIVDVVGQTVLTMAINEIDTEININNLTRGIYYLSLASDRNMSTKKLVVVD